MRVLATSPSVEVNRFRNAISSISRRRSSTPIIGNESVPKIIINNATNLVFLNYNQQYGNFKP